MIILSEMIQPAFPLFFDKSEAHLTPLNCDLVRMNFPGCHTHIFWRTEKIIPNKYEN